MSDTSTTSTTIKPPTARQEEFLKVMRDYFEKNNQWPTVRELQEALGIKSPNGVASHLKFLKKKGMVRQVGLHRTWQAVNYQDSPEVALLIQLGESSRAVLLELAVRMRPLSLSQEKLARSLDKVREFLAQRNGCRSNLDIISTIQK